MTIRPYAPADFDQAVSLLRELQAHLESVDADGLTACKPDFGPEEWRGYLKDVADMDGAVFVAEANEGDLTGFVQGVIMRHDDEAYLRAHRAASVDGWVGLLVVRGEERGKGTGGALLAHIEEYFKEKGCTQCRIKVSAHNGRTRQFYAGHGYGERDVEIARTLVS